VVITGHYKVKMFLHRHVCNEWVIALILYAKGIVKSHLILRSLVIISSLEVIRGHYEVKNVSPSPSML